MNIRLKSFNQEEESMNEEKIGGISLNDTSTATMEDLNTGGTSVALAMDEASRETKGNHHLDERNVSASGVPTDESGKSGNMSVGTSQNDVYTIGTQRLVNVSNRLSATYENQIVNIMSYIDEGRTAEAMQMAQDLVDHNMSNEVAWLMYARAKKAWGDNALAIKGFEQAIAINSRFALAYNDLGVFYGDNEQFEQAIYYLNKALEFEPTNTDYMADVVLVLGETDGTESAIEKCKYFIDISEDKILLQNILGMLYVYLSDEYLVDVPDDYWDPNCDTTPGFISLEDIQDVRKYCNEAKSLLTLDAFKDHAERAEFLLQVCDDNCQLRRCHKKIYTAFHAIMAFVFYTLITLVYGAPLAIAIAVFTFKADYFPLYVYNYIWLTGSDDPLKYSKDSFYQNHDVLKTMADGAKEAYAQADSNDDSLGWSILKAFFKSQVWFLKARLQFYKRYINQKKEQKKSRISEVKTDDIQPQA